MCKKYFHSLDCPISLLPSTSILIEGKRCFYLYYSECSLCIPDLNTDTFICCDFVILDGIKGPYQNRISFVLAPSLQNAILLCLLLQHPRWAVLGSVRLNWLLFFTCPKSHGPKIKEGFFRSMKSKFTWLFMP